MRTLFLFGNIESGGTERNVDDFVSYFSRYHSVAAVTLGSGSYEFASGIIIEDLGDLYGVSASRRLVPKAYRLLRGLWRIRRSLRRFRPDRVLAYGELPNFMACLLRFGAPWKLCCYIHNTESVVFGDTRWGRIVLAAMRLVYPKADLILGNSHGVSADMRRVLRGSKAVQTLYNPLDLEEIDMRASEPLSPDIGDLFGPDMRSIVTVGRLNKQKNQGELLEVFADLLDALPSGMNVKLIVIGEGELDGELRRKSQDLGISNQVNWLGWQANPFKIVKRCDVFLMTSLWEGLPTALIEAVAVGIACVSYDCPSGPKEIFGEENQYGVLIPMHDKQLAVQELSALLQDSGRRATLSASARERRAIFEKDVICSKYLALVEQL